MIKYNLICRKCDLTFDSWFATSKEYDKLKKKKLLNVPAGDNTIRLAPPLIVSYKDIDKSIAIINNVLKNIK